MRFSLVSKLCLILAVIAALILTAGTALAHERRDVGKYQFVVGFIVEPPFEGQKNGVDLRVTTKNPDGTDRPVEGLEKTLQVEITHIASNTSKVFALRTIFRDPGHYTNDLLLTSPGHYRFRFFGNVEGAPVNETFTTEDGKFHEVGSSTDIQFPTKLTEVREVEAAVRGAQNTAQQAQDSALKAKDNASSASALAVVGIVLGAVGIASGVGSAVLASRRQRQP
jgi:hypothetical protein